MNQSQLDYHKRQFQYTREMLDKAYHNLDGLTASTAEGDVTINRVRTLVLGAWQKLDRLERTIIADFEAATEDEIS